MKPLISKTNILSGALSPVAYFCAEYAVSDDETLYAGGLGVLAGDMLFEAGDEHLPFVAIGLKYSDTKTKADGFEILKDNAGKTLLVEVPVAGRKVFVQSWVRRFSDMTALVLLDSNVSDNPKDDREIGHLYDTNFQTRLKQQILLGIGGVRLLKSLEIEPRVYHLNEGSTAFAALALLAEKFLSVEAVQAKVVSTKHTILSIGTKIPVNYLWQMVGPYCEAHNISKELLLDKGGHQNNPDIFASTKFMLSLSGKSSGVSVLHTVFEKQKYPESTLVPITNGVYKKRWQAEGFLTEENIWTVKNELRKDLMQEVEKHSGHKLDPNICTMVWTRRLVSYKRPLAIFKDIEKLKDIVTNLSRPLQIIISGKAGETDPESRLLGEKIRILADNPIFQNRIAYVPDYSIHLAKKFVAGADIWLNTPVRGVEACGTSGMKAGLNGALMASVSDGWVEEVNWRGVGWVLSDDDADLANSIYEMLERHALPEFYDRNNNDVPEAWVNRMKETINIVSMHYCTDRMICDYDEKLYPKT